MFRPFLSKNLLKVIALTFDGLRVVADVKSNIFRSESDNNFLTNWRGVISC